MKPNVLADLLGISVQTLRRWTGPTEYGRFLSPGATPPKGKTRTLSEHDIRVLYLVASLRDAGQDPERIVERLEAEQAQEWRGLPEIPPEWSSAGETVSVEIATARAGEYAQLAALQTQVHHLEVRNQELTLALQDAQGRVVKLEQELEVLRYQREASEQEKHKIEILLLEARAEVAQLTGQLSAYSLGRDKPVNVAVLLLVTLLIGMFAVVVAAVILTVLK
jgi:DNA-binding transcriptional MerR regulator